jgi:hypothetical protein
MWECRYRWAAWAVDAGTPSPHLTPRESFTVGAQWWERVPFADLIAAVRQLDEVDR